MHTAPRQGALNGLAFLGIVLIWGTTFLAIRVSNQEGYDPFRAVLFRLVAASLLLLLLALALRVPWPRGRALGVAVVAGALMFGVNFVTLFWGELTVPSASAAVLWGIYPILMALGAQAFLAGEPLTARGLGGGALAAAGLVVVFWSHLSLDAPVAGFAAILAGIGGATIASLMVKKWAHGVHPVAYNAIGSAAGIAVAAPAAWGLGAGPFLPPSALAWAALGYLVLAGSTAFLLWTWLLHRWPATTLSFQTVLSPLVAVALGASLLAEPVDAAFLAGTALVLGGTWLAVRKPVPRPSATPEPAPDPAPKET